MKLFKGISGQAQKVRAGLVVLLASILLMVGQTRAAETVTYVYTDLQGTVLAKADAAGNMVSNSDYRPYGTQVLGTAESGPGYTGHVADPDSGLVYMQARYYDPQVGRFLSVDPAGGEAGDLFVSARYSYASNNPVLNVDPDGRQSVPGYYLTGTDFRDPATRDFAFNAFVPGYALYGCASQGCGGSQWTIAVASTFLSVASAGEAMVLGRAASRAAAPARVAAEASEASTVETTVAQLSDLRPTHGRTLSNSKMASLTKSIASDGVREPLTITKHEGASYILDGNNRFAAAYKAGLKEVPVREQKLPWGAYKSPSDLTFEP